MARWFLLCLISLIGQWGWAGDSLKPLPPEKAFVFSSSIDQQNHLMLNWNIAKGYFLYRHKFHFMFLPNTQFSEEKIIWPKPIQEKNEEGKREVYSGKLQLQIDVKENQQSSSHFVTVIYQGCSEKGFCYAPIKKTIDLKDGHVKLLQNLAQSENTIATSTSSVFLSDQNIAEKIFAKHNLLLALFSFLGLGVLLSFTPCVLPLIPILSGIIMGYQRKASLRKAFILSFSYVLGMSFTYAVAGMVIALLGSYIPAFFQNNIVIVFFSSLFVLLALSLFDVYELKLPNAWYQKISQWSNRLKGGSYISVFLMGVLSTLIVSPCVSAPLVGVLTYMAQTGDKVTGALSLFMLGFGMGIPLLLVGTSFARYLPKTGPWMNFIKRFFGFLMLAVAIYMLSKVVSATLVLFLWALLSFAIGIFLYYTRKWLLRIVGSFFLIYSLILLVGSFLGGSSLFSPWVSSTTVSKSTSSFHLITTLNELNQELMLARKTQKNVILDFYATWCTSCVLMDKSLFEDGDVKEKLSHYECLRIDITKNTLLTQAIMKKYHVVAPPTMLFFDREGKELQSKRIVGEIGRDNFLKQLNEIRKK